MSDICLLDTTKPLVNSTVVNGANLVLVVGGLIKRYYKFETTMKRKNE